MEGVIVRPYLRHGRGDRKAYFRHRNGDSDACDTHHSCAMGHGVHRRTCACACGHGCTGARAAPACSPFLASLSPLAPPLCLLSRLEPLPLCYPTCFAPNTDKGLTPLRTFPDALPLTSPPFLMFSPLGPHFDPRYALPLSTAFFSFFFCQRCVSTALCGMPRRRSRWAPHIHTCLSTPEHPHLCCASQTLKINPAKKDIDAFSVEDFEIVGYAPHKKIEMKMAV